MSDIWGLAASPAGRAIAPAPTRSFHRAILKPLAGAALATLVLTSAGAAATAEDDYLAARQAHYAAVRAAEQAGKSDEELDALDQAGRDDLEKRLLGIVGPSAFPHAAATPTFQPDTLLEGMVESGGVDGLRYGSDEGAWTYLETTDKLVAAWAEGQPEAPQFADVAGLFASDDFFTYAVGVDAAFMSYLDLPVKVGAGAVGRAAIGTFAQDTPSSPPDTLVAAVSVGGRVVVAVAPAKAKVADPKACARLKGEQDPAYLACVGKALKASAQFAAVTREAQALVEAVGKAP